MTIIKPTMAPRYKDTEPSDDPSIMELCRGAWHLASKIGNHHLALKILEEALLLHKNSALIHRVRGEIFSQVHNKIKDDNYFFDKARESAKEATRLCPNSIGFCLFYLSFLSGLNEILEECNRGLAIQKPIDPATEDFTDPDCDFKTSGERIGAMRRIIRDICGMRPINTNLLRKKADPSKVPVKQIPDYPKWKVPQMVSSVTNKEVLASEVFVKEACKEAVRISRMGTRTSLALKILEKVRLHSQNSALFHRAQGEIFYLMFATQDKNSDKYTNEYLFKARESEKEAARLSPNSLEIALNYVKLLFLCYCYKDAIEEGERALALVDTIDPAEHCLEDLAFDLPNSQERSEYMRQLILNFVEVCRVFFRESADNQVEVMSPPQKMLLAKYEKIKEEVYPRMVPLDLITDYPNQRLGEEGRKQKIAALFAIGKIIQSLEEDSIEKPESEKLLRYWNSISVDDKQKLLKLNTDELFSHFSSGSSKSWTTKRILSEAFTFYGANKSWTFRGCFCCDKKFAKPEEHLEHTMKEHVGSLSPQQDSCLPTELDDGWDSVVRKGIWCAFDASAGLRILEDKLELQPFFEEEVRVDEDRMQRAINYLFTENCPMSDDAHTSALERVQTRLMSLLENEFLAAEHVKVVTEYGMNRLEVLFPDSRLWELGLHQTHLCICFLGLTELNEILKFLEEIIKTVSSITGKEQVFHNISKANSPHTDIKERIDLNGKSLCLLMDEQFISPSDDSAAPDEDAVFKSIVQGSSSEEGLEKWVQLEKERKEQGKEPQQILKENVNSMKKWCDQKSDLLRSQKATNDLAHLLNSEFMARKHSSEHAPRSYEAILQKQQDEIEGAIPGKDGKSRLDVLKQALSVDYKHEEISPVVRTKICEMDMYEDGEVEKPIPFQQVDNCIKEAMQNIAKSIGLKILKADAKIMRADKENEKLEAKLNIFSGADYRTILLPLVKSCIMAKLEKQANIAVEEKSEVAKEENQAHVAPETKKSVNEKGNQSKKKKKSAQKKKNKKDKDARELQSCTYKKEEIASPDDADSEKDEERLRCEAEEEGRMLQENLRRYQKSLDDQKNAYLAQQEREAAQQTDTPGLSKTTTASTDSAAAAAADGSSTSNVPIARDDAEANTRNIRYDNLPQQPEASSIVCLHGTSQSEAARLLARRWEAIMQAYNDPSTKLSERPTMYSSEPGLEPPVPAFPDFLAALRQKIRDFHAAI